MNVKRKSTAFVALAALILLFIDVFPSTPAQSPLLLSASVSDLGFGQLDWYNSSDQLEVPNSLWCEMNWSYVADPTTTYYLNVYVSLVMGGPGSWAVQNLPIFAVSANGSASGHEAVHVNLAELNLTQGVDLPEIFYDKTVDSSIRTTPPGPATAFAIVRNQKRLATDDPSRFPEPGPMNPGEPVGVKLDSPPVLLSADRDIGPVQEDKKKCMPGAFARSLDWLNRENKLGLGKTAQEIYEELIKKKVGSDTTSLEDDLKAKAEYARDISGTKERIVTKVWDGDNKVKPIPGIKEEGGTFIDWLENEIKTEDVELAYYYPGGAHMVTVVGVYKDEKGNVIVKFREDDKQGDHNNGDEKVKETKVYIKNGVPRFDGDNNKIGFAVSESVEEEQAYEPIPYGPLVSVFLGSFVGKAVDAACQKLENGTFDFFDMPLNADWIQKWSNPPYSNCIALSYEGPWGTTAMRKRYSGGNGEEMVYPDDGENRYRGADWRDVVDLADIGLVNLGTCLNAHPDGFEADYGQTVMRYGYPTTNLNSLNPLYATAYYDWQVLEKIYDKLLTKDIDGIVRPWLAERWSVETYNNPVYGTCSKFIFTLRPDAVWADGTPLTIADVYFTFYELPLILSNLGYPEPSWIGNVDNIIGFAIIDPFNFEVLLNDYDPSAFENIQTQVILPKHIWKPIVESGDPTAFKPDSNLVGSGAWILTEYVQDSHFKLVPNTRFFRYPPVSVDLRTTNYATKTNLPHLPGQAPSAWWTIVPLNVTMNNLWQQTYEGQGGTLTVDKYVYVDDTPLAAFYGIDLSTDPHYEEFAVNLSKCSHQVKVAVCITGPTELRTGVPNPWIGSWINVTLKVWITITEDITGNYYVNPQLLAPDCKVDVKDVYAACRAYGSLPGYARWNSVADVNRDYKVDIKDIYQICKMFGKW
jgi:hypothetical protein